MRRPDNLSHRRDFTEYLNRIGSIPLLSAEEEVEHAKQIEVGLFAVRLLVEGPASLGARNVADKEELQHLADMGSLAKEKMVNANYRLVIKPAVAATEKVESLGIMDLIQEGNEGLIRAVEKFDYTKGFKFSTYATSWISQAIQRARHNRDRMIRLPQRAEIAIDQGALSEEVSEALSHEERNLLRVLSLYVPNADGHILLDVISDTTAVVDLPMENTDIADMLRDTGLSDLERDAVIGASEVTVHDDKVARIESARSRKRIAEKHSTSLQGLAIHRKKAIRKLVQNPAVIALAVQYGYVNEDEGRVSA